MAKPSQNIPIPTNAPAHPLFPLIGHTQQRPQASPPRKGACCVWARHRSPSEWPCRRSREPAQKKRTTPSDETQRVQNGARTTENKSQFKSMDRKHWKSVDMVVLLHAWSLRVYIEHVLMLPRDECFSNRGQLCHTQVCTEIRSPLIGTFTVEIWIILDHIFEWRTAAKVTYWSSWLPT